MTLRHFLIFTTVYSCLSFTIAAEQLDMTQPAVSIAIRDMERHYHTQFFVRTKKNLTITPAGQQMYRFATAALKQAQAAENAFETHSRQLSIAVGSNVTSASSFFSDVVINYAKSHKNICISFVVNTSSYIEKLIGNGTLDIGMSDLPTHNDELYSFPVTNEKLTLLCSPDFMATLKLPLTPEKIATLPLLLREKGSGSRETFDNNMLDYGLRVTPVMECTNHNLLIGAAKRGMGILVIPRSAARTPIKNGNLVELSLDSLNLVKRQYFILRKDAVITQPIIDITGIIASLYPDSPLAKHVFV